MDIVTFHTIGDPYYEAAAERFRAAVPGARILALPDSGSWIENCRKKPLVIAALGRPGHSLLWIDVDNDVRELPEEPEGVDFAAVPSEVAGRDWWAGCLYFADTPAGRVLPYYWAETVGIWPGASDEAALNRAWRAFESPIRGAQLHAPGIVKGLSGNASKYNRERRRG